MKIKPCRPSLTPINKHHFRPAPTQVHNSTIKLLHTQWNQLTPQRMTMMELLAYWGFPLNTSKRMDKLNIIKISHKKMFLLQLKVRKNQLLSLFPLNLHKLKQSQNMNFQKSHLQKKNKNLLLWFSNIKIFKRKLSLIFPSLQTVMMEVKLDQAILWILGYQTLLFSILYSIKLIKKTQFKRHNKKFLKTSNKN